MNVCGRKHQTEKKTLGRGIAPLCFVRRGFPGTIELQVDIKSFALRSLNLHALNFTSSFVVENPTHSSRSNGVSQVIP